jgi:putative zinc finger/helix-turn-helix YgiT family protein
MEKKCPICESEGTISKNKVIEIFKIKGEGIEVEYEVFKCDKCGETFIDSNSDNDPFNYAYRKYRKIHNMLQPEDIRETRKKYGITQTELSRLLGVGGATLSRYENGALQDKAHDSQLKLINDPRNMLKIIRENIELFGEIRAKALVANLEKIVKDEYPIERCLEEYYSSREKTIFTGFQPLDINKLLNSFLFFCKDGLLKTKINKYLFYADFKHFKEYTLGITGATYVHLPLGPVPNNYEIFLSSFVNEGYLTIEEVYYSDPNIVGEKYISKERGNLSDFSDSEIKVLSTIKEFFKDYSAKDISKYSHEERAYLETDEQALISYDYAKFIKI